MVGSRSEAAELTGKLQELRENTSQIENLAHYMKEYRLNFDTAESILNSIKCSFLSSTKISRFSESIPTLQELASSSVAFA